MFIIIKNASKMPPNFGDALRSVTESVYDNIDAAQKGAMDLSSANPGSFYTVFELVMKGTAITTPAPPPLPPPPVWMPT